MHFKDVYQVFLIQITSIAKCHLIYVIQDGLHSFDPIIKKVIHV